MGIKNIKDATVFIKQNRLVYLLLFPIIFLRKLILRLKARRFEKFYSSTFKSVEKGSLVVRIPDFEGIFEIDFRSHILKRILKDKHYEPIFVEVVKKYVDPQKDVLDVGANVGLFAILFSKIISCNNRVLAVEPAPLALDYLRRNIERNCPSQTIIVFEGLATNEESIFRLNIIQGMEEYSSLGNIVHPSVQGRSNESIEVKSSTIDNIVNEFNLKPGFIKIDTEGAEYLVVSGAINTLMKYRPVILSELSDTLLSSFGDTSEKVIKLLQINGYKIVNAEAPSVPIRHPFNGEILALPIEE